MSGRGHYNIPNKIIFYLKRVLILWLLKTITKAKQLRVDHLICSHKQTQKLQQLPKVSEEESGASTSLPPNKSKESQIQTWSSKLKGFQQLAQKISCSLKMLSEPRTLYRSLLPAPRMYSLHLVDSPTQPRRMKNTLYTSAESTQ